MRHGTWTKEEVLSAFLAGESLNALCKRVGGSRNTIREVLKEQLGEAKFQAIRDKNDPKKCTATEEELLASFHTNEAFKDIAARINTSPNTLRDRWVKAFGKEAFDARSKKFHSAAGIRAGSAWKGKKRVSEEALQARDADRGVDRRCPVCNVGCVGYQALIHHMIRAKDEAHTKALKEVRKQTEDVKWAALDFVTCAVCGVKSELLNNHIKLHGLTAFEYRLKYPGCPLTTSSSESKRLEALAPHYQFLTLNLTKENLLPFVDENGAVIPLKAAKALHIARGTVLYYCRKLGLPTRNKLVWQRYVLDSAAEVYGVYKWEWSDPKIVNPETGWAFRFDGYFPEHNVIVEAHGEQHYRYSESWHGTLENFHKLRERDAYKRQAVEERGYRYVRVRTTDPIQDVTFWQRALQDPQKVRAEDVESVFRVLREQAFPNSIPDGIELKKALTRLQKLHPILNLEREVHPYSTIGTVACGTFFPNRYRARRQGGRSAWDMWYDDIVLKKAIHLQLDSGHPTTPERVLKAVVMFNRTPSVFRPVVAKYIYENYCPKGGIVWDPCAGYGGRLLGAMAAGVGRYIGTDLEDETAQGNQSLAEALECSTRCRVECVDATTFDPGEPLDLVFTSPPYFDLEVYGRKFEDSLHGLSIEQWVQLFLGSIVSRSFQCLKSGGFLILNLPQKPVNGLRLDLAGSQLVQGLIPRNSVYMPIRDKRRGMKREPLLIWQKP